MWWERRTPKQKYSDFINADCGLMFAEYLGIEVPDLDYGCDGTVRFRSSKATGDWCKLKKDAKASYKARLKDSKR